MYIEKYEKLPKLTDEEVREQAENIFNFLKLTHQFMENKGEAFYNPCKSIAEQVNASSMAIELRALRRDRADRPYYRNFKLYRFADSELERLYKFLLELNNKEIPYCLYYSVYCFDNYKMAVNKQGKKSEEWNNKIAINNAIGTQILIADFDNITEDDFILEKIKLAKIGLETLDIFSGHGFQSIILLDKPTEDKELLKKFTNLMLSKGFKVDHKIKDCARIMRLTDVFNSKELIKTSYENPMIIKTKIYNYTEKRYSLDYVFECLDKLETVRDITQENKPKVTKEKSSKEEVETPMQEQVKTNVIEMKDNLQDLSYDINKLKELYPMLDINKFPQPVLSMLEGFRNGYANSMLLYLTLYLKDMGYSKSVILEAMQVLCNQDRFNYAWNESIVKSEVNRFYHSNYDWRAIYASELQEFGYINYEFRNKEIVIINNYTFDVLNKISSKAFYIYLKLLEDNNYTGRKVYTINEISEATKVPRRTLVQHLDDLAKSDVKLLDKKRANRRKKEEYTYYLTEYLTDSRGFTKINISMLKYLLLLVDTKEINPTQLSICLYIKHICYNGKSDCIISQESLANALGLDRTSISKSFKNMEKTRLIRADKIDISDFKFKYSYTIHF